MPKLDLYISTDIEISKEDIADLKIIRETQMTALKIWLANFVVYEGKEISFELMNKATIDERFNPLRVGTKSIVSVIKKLSNKNYVKLVTGQKRYQKDEHGDLIQGKLSSTSSTPKVLELANRLGVSSKTIKQLRTKTHARMRDVKKRNRFLNYKDTDYTLQVEKVMSEYCEYLNRHKIKLKEKVYEDIHLYRTYTNRNGNNFFYYGGRSGGYWMNEKKELRPFITINNKKTVSVDMHFSQINILYQKCTGKYKEENEDAYKIEGVDKKFRPIIKKWMTMMLNTSYGGTSQAMTNWYKDDAKPEEQKLYEEFFSLKEFSKRKTNLSDQLIEKHQDINHLFCLGADYGNYYQWLESNMVFDVAHQCALADVPVLTVHDEYIVREEDEDYLKMVMYSTADTHKGLDFLYEIPKRT